MKMISYMDFIPSSESLDSLDEPSYAGSIGPEVFPSILWSHVLVLVALTLLGC